MIDLPMSPVWLQWMIVLFAIIIAVDNVVIAIRTYRRWKKSAMRAADGD